MVSNDPNTTNETPETTEQEVTYRVFDVNGALLGSVPLEIVDAADDAFTFQGDDGRFYEVRDEHVIGLDLHLNVPAESALAPIPVDLSGVTAGQTVANFIGMPIGTVARAVDGKQFVMAREDSPDTPILSDMVAHIDDESGVIYLTEETSEQLVAMAIDSEAAQPEFEDVWIEVKDGKMGEESLDLSMLPTPMTVIDVNGTECGMLNDVKAATDTNTVVVHTVFWEMRVVPVAHIVAINCGQRTIRLNVTKDEFEAMVKAFAAL